MTVDILDSFHLEDQLSHILFSSPSFTLRIHLTHHHRDLKSALLVTGRRDSGLTLPSYYCYSRVPLFLLAWRVSIAQPHSLHSPLRLSATRNDFQSPSLPSILPYFTLPPSSPPPPCASLHPHLPFCASLQVCSSPSLFLSSFFDPGIGVRSRRSHHPSFPPRLPTSVTCPGLASRARATSSSITRPRPFPALATSPLVARSLRVVSIASNPPTDRQSGVLRLPLLPGPRQLLEILIPPTEPIRPPCVSPV